MSIDVVDAWVDPMGTIVVCAPRWLAGRVAVMHVLHSRTNEVRRRWVIGRGECVAVTDGSLIEGLYNARRLCRDLQP
jgi:hypothetical protein